MQSEDAAAVVAEPPVEARHRVVHQGAQSQLLDPAQAFDGACDLLLAQAHAVEVGGELVDVGPAHPLEGPRGQARRSPVSRSPDGNSQHRRLVA
jgi:hypothetical protein